MKVLRREWYGVSRSDEWRLYPLGDVHLGNAACDEKMFRSVVNAIAQDDKALWIGMGDYCEFINVADKRFSATSLASWVKVVHLADLARAQRDRFLEIVKPIASKCVGLVGGNHELVVHKHTERDIYSDIVAGVKESGGFAATDNLAFGYSGWLTMAFYRSEEKRHATVIRAWVHHGFTGGRMPGAKANAMQRALHSHDADLIIMGHSHNDSGQLEAVETVRGNEIVLNHRLGVFGGTFLGPAEYAEVKGYPPMPVAQPIILLRPGEEDQARRIRVMV